MAIELNLQEQLEKLKEILAATHSTTFWETVAVQDETKDGDVLEAQESDVPGLRHLKASIHKEIESIETHLALEAEGSSQNTLSTNTLYYLALWNEILLAPRPIISLGRTFELPKEMVHTETKSGKKINKVKVDIVAENGHRWLRVNTTKESRLLGEFRAIEAFGYESSDEDEANPPKTSRRLPLDKYLDNTAENGGDRPIIQLQLSRLGQGDSAIQDERIKHTLTCLRDMGIQVSPAPEATTIKLIPDPTPPSGFYTPSQINLDLSMLIAIVTDISHAPLPTSSDAVDELFRPQAERSWRRQLEKNPRLTEESLEHCRALAEQTRHEMDHGLVETILRHLHSAPDAENARFWTTKEAKDRFLAIIEKIGGEDELRRARAMFSLDDNSSELFWSGSRIPAENRPRIVPISILPDEEPSPSRVSVFQRQIVVTCKAILSRPLRPEVKSSDTSKSIHAPMRFAARLSVHTIQSLLLGAQSGMLTITSNKTSIKHLLREMRGFSLPSALPSTLEPTTTSPLAILVLEPRSLSQSMRSDYGYET